MSSLRYMTVTVNRMHMNTVLSPPESSKRFSIQLPYGYPLSGLLLLFLG